VIVLEHALDALEVVLGLVKKLVPELVLLDVLVVQEVAKQVV